MGTLSGKIFGFPSGKAGDLIFRVRDGKVNFYTAPGKIGIKRSEKQKTNNRYFGYCASFCSALDKIKVFHECWDKAGGDSLPYQKMMKANLCRTNAGYDISEMILIPSEEKYQVDINEISLNNESLSVAALPLGGNVIVGKRISLQGVLQLLTPEDENRNPFSFIPFHVKDQDFSEVMPIRFYLQFSNQIGTAISEYRQKNMLMNFIIKDTESTPEYFSEEVYIENL